MLTCDKCGGSDAVRLGRRDGSPGVCGDDFHNAEWPEVVRPSAHSPGPWSLGCNGAAVTVWDVLNRCVATVPAWSVGKDERGGSPHTLRGSAANARLLRTAPELRRLAADLAETTFSADEASGAEVLARICRFKRRAARLLAYTDEGACDFIGATHE